MNDRGWTEYRLSKECGLSESTLANIFKRNTCPSFNTLQSIGNAFGITISQFFADNKTVELNPELKELFDNWVSLTPHQKSAVINIIKAFNSDNDAL